MIASLVSWVLFLDGLEAEEEITALRVLALNEVSGPVIKVLKGPKWKGFKREFGESSVRLK
jgi:hypothetical protein